MKIKYFKYINNINFKDFIYKRGYKLDDVKAFYLVTKKQYRNVILKVYTLHFVKGGFACFSVVKFKDYDHLLKTSLGLNGDHVLYWYQKSDIKEY